MERDINKKLNDLLKLQNIDSRIFDIKKIRGALPDEVQDLEDELIGYKTRLENHVNETENFNNSIDDYKNKTDAELKKIIDSKIGQPQNEMETKK